MVAQPWMRRLRAARGKVAFALLWGVCAISVGFGVSRGSGSPTYLAVARPQAWPLVAPCAGSVADLRVSPGQLVEAGDVLAVIHAPGLAEELALAEATRAALEARLSVEDTDRDRKFARDLDASRIGVAGARVALEQAEATLAGLDVQLRRATSPGVGLAALETDALATQRARVAAEVSARKDALVTLEAAYGRARSRAGANADADLSKEIDAANAQVETLRARVAAGRVLAPVRGVVGVPVAPLGRDGRADTVVTEVFPVVGQWVVEGVPLLTLTAPESAEAIVYVEPSRVGTFAPGARLAVRTARGDVVMADVRSVGAAVEPVPLRQLREPGVLEWGVPVTLAVPGGMVPGEAVSVDLTDVEAPVAAAQP